MTACLFACFPWLASHRVVVPAPGRQIREPSEDDEIRFSGLHTKKAIPSKSFKMLQRITDNSCPEENGGGMTNNYNRYLKLVKNEI